MRIDLPSGTVTFLFTDVEGSTYAELGFDLDDRRPPFLAAAVEELAVQDVEL